MAIAVFFVTGDPKTQGSMRQMRGRVVHDQGPRLMYWRNDVRGKAFDAMAGRAPFEGPVHVETRFLLERPKSVPVKKRPQPTAKPDLDKLARAVGDALTGVCWKDDAQVVAWLASKDYAPSGTHPGVLIHVVAETEGE